MISVEQFERSYYAEYLSDYRVGETLKRNSSTIKRFHLTVLKAFESVRCVDTWNVSTVTRSGKEHGKRCHV